MSNLTLPQIDRLKEICLLLNKSMDAFGYYHGLGFQNACGDFEIDEDLYEISQPLIDEFETIIEYLSPSKYIICLFDDNKCDVLIYSLHETY